MDQDSFARVPRTQAETLVLDALRHGSAGLRTLAARARLTLTDAGRALAALAADGLVVKPSRRGGRWQFTDPGAREVPTPTTDPTRRRIAVREASAAHRFLTALDRPMPVRVVAERIGVSKEGATQAFFVLYAAGLVRTADPERASAWVARADDPTPLFPVEVERVLQSFDEETATGIVEIARALRLPEATVGAAIEKVIDAGLVVERTGRFGTSFALTDNGRGHPQRRVVRKRAPSPPLPVRSQRVHATLYLLAARGPLRTVDIGRALSVGRSSINALMQYLKRKGLAAKDGDTLLAPHRITDLGVDLLAELTARQPLGARAAEAEARLCLTERPETQAVRSHRKRHGSEGSAADADRRPPKPSHEVALPVKSERIREVLQWLCDFGPGRAIAIARTLGLPASSTNALMQHLKRKKLVEKVGDTQRAPHAITIRGREVLLELNRRQAPPHAEDTRRQLAP